MGSISKEKERCADSLRLKRPLWPLAAYLSWWVVAARSSWYKSGTRLSCRLWRVRNARPAGLAVPIHHRGDGEAAGEWSGL